MKNQYLEKRSITITLFVVLFVFAVQIITRAENSRQTQGKEYRSNSVRLWIPDGVDTIRGVFWIINRGDTKALYDDKITHKDDPSLPEGVEDYGSRAVMKELGLAMAYDSTDVGKGTDILAELETFAELSGHSELTFAGIIPTGISGGGSATSTILSELPNRVITAFPSHGGKANVDVETKKIPRLDFTAAEDNFTRLMDSDERISSIMQGREQDAPWAEFIVPTGVHPWWQWLEFQVMAEWLRAVLPMRLPDEVSLDKPIQLKPVRVSTEHWLGALEYKNIGDFSIERVNASPFLEYPVDRKKAHWLPDEKFASFWVKSMTQPARITSFSAPEKVTPGSILELSIGYTAPMVCDIVVYIASPSMVRADGWPRTKYGETRVRVEAGAGTTTVQLKVNDDIPLKIDGYHFMVYIVRPDGGEGKRIDGTLKRAVDCVSM